MKRIVVLASALIFTASVTVFGQTQQTTTAKPTSTSSVKHDQAKPASNTSTSTSTTTMKQEQSKPATATTAHMTATPVEKNHMDITSNDLPKAAQEYINRTYPGKKIEKAEKFTDSKGVVTYKAEVSGMIMHFDAAGKMMGDAKKEMKPATENKTTTTPTTQPAKSSEKKKQ